jgi:hypothetical protein
MDVPPTAFIKKQIIMKKKLLLLLVVSIAGLLRLDAQDTIYTVDGMIVSTQAELDSDEQKVRYKQLNNPSGPAYIKSLRDVIKIHYASGDRDFIEIRDGEIKIRHIAGAKPKSTTQTQPQTSPPAAANKEEASLASQYAATAQSNGTLTLLKLDLPDSIIFTMAEGKEVEKVFVELLTDDRSFDADVFIRGIFHVKTSANNGVIYSYTDQTMLIGKNFKLPHGVQPKGIRFSVEGNKMYYNTVLKKWEPTGATGLSPLATGQKPATEPQAQQTQTPEQNIAAGNGNDYATVYIYRPKKMAGMAISYDLNMKDETVFRVKNNSCVTLKLTQAGTYNLWAKTESKTELPLNVEMGKTYYIRCGLSMGVAVGRPKLEIMDAETGKKEFDKVDNK